MLTYLISLWLWGEASCISDVTTFGWRSDWSDVITAGHGRLRRWFAVTHLDILFKKGKQCDNHSFRAKKKYMMYYDFKPGVWQVAIFEFDCLRPAWLECSFFTWTAVFVAEADDGVRLTGVVDAPPPDDWMEKVFALVTPAARGESGVSVDPFLLELKAKRSRSKIWK